MMGKVGTKVWLYRGDILPQPKEETEDIGTIEVTLQSGDEDSGVEMENASAQES